VIQAARAAGREQLTVGFGGPTSHPLAGCDSLGFKDLRDESFIANPVLHRAGPPATWLAEQQRHGLPGRVAAETASLQETLTLVATGLGVCLLPGSVARIYPRSDIRYVEVSDAAPAVVSLAWRHQSSQPVVDAVVRTVRQVAAAHPEALTSP
jgi:DNA-binding transcriptional LysR family regulator